MSSSDLPRLLIVIGSSRPGRLGHHVGRWFEYRVREHGQFEPVVADLAEIALPFFDEPRHPRLGDYAHQHTRDWAALVGSTDAVVLVTPEYNHGPSAVLKNAIDFLHAEWRDKPVGFVSYGGVAAGTRAVQQLVQIVATVRMIPVFDAVAISGVRQVVGEGGEVASTQSMDRSSIALLDELARLLQQLHPVPAGN
ncbi:NADPH-dependent FMN reductase [Aeromicrobium wangtongii]|uniref:NAD(P)H-dependent oxidoreductase n=1 Tax=Aeromicrobium wangtongii TaxID=2969247 RepID=A0ABY5M7K1_9ACTN|nr:NAD(P)H-dependent oxidoreductase [Aeromicrobium wangtongii]MCD9199055.1 NAD(P)H-dependent oxidoreductase [Aeromicrobium wangtongii]UUP12914.1 NAD(P)H-dependent oxidoreductase [Aeromicrobium wangtongii]